MTPVRDRGSCKGAKAIFSTLAALEWHVGKITGEAIPLSVQYIIDCPNVNTVGDNCNGDELPTSVIKGIMQYQYLPYEEDYKYTEDYQKGRCNEVDARHKLRNALSDVWVYDYVPLGNNPEAIRAALQTGPTINALNTGDLLHESDGIYSHTDCVSNYAGNVMTFVGWQLNGGNPYYILRSNNGDSRGDKGYFKYADNESNENCRDSSRAYSLVVGPRKELQYELGEGKLSFKEARTWCQNELGSDWDLAHVPTEMHRFEVYDLFTETYGKDKKKDKSFNYFWIGLFNTMTGDSSNLKKWVWVNGIRDAKPNEITGTDIQYARFDKSGIRKYRFGVMKKVKPRFDKDRGLWETRQGFEKYRFVCSRYL